MFGLVWFLFALLGGTFLCRGSCRVVQGDCFLFWVLFWGTVRLLWFVEGSLISVTCVGLWVLFWYVFLCVLWVRLFVKSML